MKPKRKPSKPSTNLPEVAENQKAAASAWGIPIAVIRAAKADGCQAFQGSRVRRDPLLEWIKKNSGASKQAEVADLAKADSSELKRLKLANEVELSGIKIDREKRTTIPRDEAKAEWARAVGIVEDEAKGLMEPDHYRIFIDRIKKRIGTVLPT